MVINDAGLTNDLDEEAKTDFQPPQAVFSSLHW